VQFDQSGIALIASPFFAIFRDVARLYMSQHSIGLDDDEPLVVSPRRTCLILGIGTTKLYELLNSGELDSYCEGKARRITMSSIRRRIDRLIAENRMGPVPGTAKQNADSRPSVG